VADVPDHAIIGRLEDGVQRDRELDGAEARGEMSTGGGTELDQLVAQLPRDLGELLAGQTAERARLVDRAQETQRVTPPSSRITSRRAAAKEFR
jgi:hypothetical protein